MYKETTPLIGAMREVMVKVFCVEGVNLQECSIIISRKLQRNCASADVGFGRLFNKPE